MEARGHEPRAARGGAPVADPRRPGRGRDPASRRADARDLARDQPGHGHRRVQPAARAGLCREQAGLRQLGNAAGRPPIGSGRDRRWPRARHADRRAAGAGGARGGVPVGGARASPLARPPRLRPARPAAPAPGDCRLVRSPRAADAARADPRHQRRDARARPVDQGGAPARAARARGGPELPGRARRAASRRRPPDAGADDTRGLGPRRAPHGGAESPAGVRVPDAGLPQPHRRAGRRGRRAGGRCACSGPRARSS